MRNAGDVKEFFGKEKLLMKIGKVPAALSSLDKFIADQPEDIHLDEAYYLRAQCFGMLAAEGKASYDEVVGANEEVFSLFPNSKWAPEAILASGIGYYKLGLYYEALGQFQLLFEKFPKSEQREAGLYWTAESDFQIRRYQEAEKGYRKYIETYPDSDRYRNALVRLGECLSLQERHEEAEQVFDRVIREWPELLTFLPPKTLLTMGESFRNKGRIKTAAELFLLAVNVYPDSEVADRTLWELARSYDETGETDKAATTYALTAQLFPGENVAYQSRLRLAKMGIDDTPLRVELPADQATAYKRPIETMRLMLQEAPDEIRDRIYYELANGEARKGLYREAVMSYHGLVTEYPDSALAGRAKEETLPTFKRLIMILKRDGDDYQIVKDYERLFLPMDATLKDALVLYTIGESYATLDLLDEAAARAREALSVCENDDLEQTIYSSSYKWDVLRGNTTGLRELLEQYLKRHPNGKLRDEFQLALAQIFLKELKYTQAASLLLDLLPTKDDAVDRIAAEAALTLGKLYLQTDLPSSAVHYVSRAKKLLPEGVDTEFTTTFLSQCNLILADELYTQKSFETARSFYEEVIESKVGNEDRAWAAYRLALLQKRAGDEKGFNMSSQLLESFTDVEPWPQVGRTMRQISELKENLKRIL
ncbi:MAG: tetratricopeptide repeat protein [Deltaproteobacteria bacterium]|nr:tetratricopeptide repeat protein [Deltaproteobacteria bacterium]